MYNQWHNKPSLLIMRKEISCWKDKVEKSWMEIEFLRCTSDGIHSLLTFEAVGNTYVIKVNSGYFFKEFACVLKKFIWHFIKFELSNGSLHCIKYRNFTYLVLKFCGNAYLPQSFAQFTRNSAETLFPQNFHTRK